MTDAFKTQSRGGLSEGDRYLAFLAIALLGYALMGKGFAYLGFPPLYMGEIVFFIGAVVFLRTGALVASLATLPGLMLVALMVWVLARTIPFVSVYGFDALRDSAVIMYGGFAFIVIGLLLKDARRIDTVLRYYNILVVSLPRYSWGSVYRIRGGIHPKLLRSRGDRNTYDECGRDACRRNHDFRSDRLSAGLFPLVSGLARHAYRSRHDQSRSYDRRPWSGRVYDAHAGTTTPVGDRNAGGNRHFRRSPCDRKHFHPALACGRGRGPARSQCAPDRPERAEHCSGFGGREC